MHFRAEHQKTGYEHSVPLGKECSDILAEHTARLSDEPTALLFPADRDVTKPVDRWTISRRLREAYRHAGLQPLSGGLWHPWRRKWATERKDMPLVDVAAAGGWKETRTLLASYQQPDDGTLQRVALEAPKLYASGVRRGAEVTPVLTPRRTEKAKPRRLTDDRASSFAIGTAGFEPATPWTPFRCATELRHVPMSELPKSTTFLSTP